MTTLTAGQAENYYDKDDLYRAQGSEVSEGRIANTMGFDPDRGLLDEFVDKEQYQKMIRDNEQFKTVEFEINLSESFKKSLIEDPKKKEYFNQILEKNLRQQAKKSGLKLQENRFIFSREGILRGEPKESLSRLPPHHVQEMLGHASLESTQIYTRVAVKKLKDVHSATHPGARLERHESGGFF